MKRIWAVMTVAAIGCFFVGNAQAAFDEPQEYRVEVVEGSLSTTLAGAHPDFTVAFALSKAGGEPYALTRDLVFNLPPGLFGNPKPFPTCSTLQFGSTPDSSECPQDSQVGVSEITLGGSNAGLFEEPVYNMNVSGGGLVAKFGVYAALYPTFINVRLNPADDTLIAAVERAPSAAELISAKTTFWGVPASPEHDEQRLTPSEANTHNSPPGGRPSNLPETPFMTNPTSCEPGQEITLTATSYQLPESPSVKSGPVPTITGCEFLSLSPEVSAKPTTEMASTGSGFDYEMELPTKGLEFQNLRYDSEARRVEVVLPEGLTVNPSEAEGLGVCSEADFARETYLPVPNQGCPETSKIGSVTALTPVLPEDATGALYLAQPYRNPFGSLLALYMTLKVPNRGVLVKLSGRVTPDPLTGRLVTVFDEIPQLPVSSFKLHFREGARAPLITPPACGTYDTISHFQSWAKPNEVVDRDSTFAISSGVAHGPCPSGGLPPLHPGLLAGMVNNAAGSYSPFNVRLTRTDAEQEITNFSLKLPPGLVARLSGIPFCSDPAIAAAKGRNGIHGGEEELLAPSCPAASQIGSTLVGTGVGDVLTYVPGKVYLAGPYHGSALSIAAITAAKAGPFDLGTVVVREALEVNPETAEVFVDATGSDPIPHIIQGIPVHLRDIRVYIDRPNFTINPTSCAATSTASTVRGAGLDFVSEADNNPVTVATRFQAADCAALGFKPKLKLFLRGGTKRNQVPALRAVLTARPGDANIAKATVVLPHSEFLEQGHIGTVCTRVQFDAGQGNGQGCPAASIYGRARAVTPILDEPLEGSVFLRSNGGERQLPDLVAALHSGKIDIDVVGYIDSVRERNNRGEVVSRIRTRFEHVPDAPVSKFVLEMKGGKKGLLVNSTDLCRGRHRAELTLSAHNGRNVDTQPEVKASCGRRKSK
jgi:hypothetical protein